MEELSFIIIRFKTRIVFDGLLNFSYRIAKRLILAREGRGDGFFSRYGKLSINVKFEG